MPGRNQVLLIIVLAQFCCTSLWFAGNGVMADLIRVFDLNLGALGHLTSAVQFGFISGTLIFALFTIADRVSPSKVFLWSAVAGALCNLGILWDGNDLVSLIILRAATGFFLAGIYPVGMKIAADYYKQGLGKSLGYLVGALVLGTAFPHLLQSFPTGYQWEYVILVVSALAIAGGISMVLLVPDGPNRKPGKNMDLAAAFKVFGNADFRAAAFGYFGHMWELYAFWTFTPLLLHQYSRWHGEALPNISMWSFLIIGIGSLACIAGGYLSVKWGEARVAFISLGLSGLCCLLSPLFFLQGSSFILLLFLLFWGMVVVADSPLFSTMVAHNTDPHIKGSALTLVNCIGFSITIISIQLLTLLLSLTDLTFLFLILLPGPILGLWALRGMALPDRNRGQK
ncbi:MFS transporter [Zeaxanthinibacter sp. PT1]|uniref:MFS transporter n=1 Tax=Zeaxanthinibacter TaxID=561554 RepID=UPI00234BC356|nr:MFS transporter [Zeaxanthinibacter sp. PT1]MDC6350925.1 MFS transporter [Zeaxanthinibacter sp. PT1]